MSFQPVGSDKRGLACDQGQHEPQEALGAGAGRRGRELEQHGGRHPARSGGACSFKLLILALGRQEG